jgi:ABC-type multidrug transport system ATPase subunit
MAVVNHAKMEINAKIVYFGPPGSGKSTALQYIFSRIKPSLRGKMKT